MASIRLAYCIDVGLFVHELAMSNITAVGVSLTISSLKVIIIPAVFNNTFNPFVLAVVACEINFDFLHPLCLSK